MTAVRPLPPCRRRDCVSTQAPRTDPLRRIEPLAFHAGLVDVTDAALRALGRVPRLKVLERDATSVRAVVRSPWLRLTTEVELRIDAGVGLVHLSVSTPFALRERSRSRSRAHELLALIDREVRRA